MEQSQVRSELARRFFTTHLLGKTNRKYYDTLTQQRNLQQQHIVGVAMSMGIQSLSQARRMIESIHFAPITEGSVYRPYQPEVVVEYGLASRNLWRPSKVTPDPEADASPFVEHLKLVLHEDDRVEYLLDLMAWRYQNMRVDSKPAIAPYMYCEEGGHGKTLFIETLEAVYGSAAVKSINTTKGVGSMSQVELWGRSWFCIDEAKIPRGSAAYDTLKSYTGKNRTESDNKNKNFAEYEIPALLLMMSNRAPSFLEDRDRRFWVVTWKIEGMTPDEKAAYFIDYRDWLEKRGGHAAIAGLLQTRDVSHRNLFEDAPMTHEKQVALGLTQDPTVDALREYLDNNEDVRLFRLDAFSTIWRDHNTKSSAQPHKLTEVGLEKYGRMKIAGKQHYVWHRKGDNFTKGPDGVLVGWDDDKVELAVDVFAGISEF